MFHKMEKNFYKFWWNKELKAAKAASVESNNLWKVAGKPRQGPIVEKRQRTRLVYRQLLRDEEKREKTSYANDLHDALLLKMVKDFGVVGVQNLNHRSRVLGLTAARRQMCYCRQIR